MKVEKELEKIKDSFIASLYVDYGAFRISDKVTKWYDLSWNELCLELRKERIDLLSRPRRDWQAYFFIQKEKYLILKKETYQPTFKI